MASAPLPGSKALPNMMTSIRITDAGQVEIVDQLLLPHTVKWDSVSTPEEAFDAIKTMKVGLAAGDGAVGAACADKQIRGAPAIASLAALSVRSHLSASPAFASPAEVVAHVSPVLDYLQSSRPTAVNLGQAMDRVRAVLKAAAPAGGAAEARELIGEIKDTCFAVHEEDFERNRTMGRLGAEWLWKQRGGKDGKKGLKVITVCNTGSLATSGYGTAIGVITALYEAGQLDTAYYAQTTPYHQGSRLTSLELTTLQIPACMICDTMLGSLMQHEDIDGVIVGADRVVKNGDTANKIGTYQAAVLAQRHNVPFIVVAPVTTVDLSLETGAQIHIEQRPPVEATLVRGKNLETGGMSVVRISPEGVGSGPERWNQVYNPSFDVTPAELISAVVTEKGVAERSSGAVAIDVATVC